MKNRFRFHHGSPGLADDLNEALKRWGILEETERPFRYGSLKEVSPDGSEIEVEIGYSFGSLYALERASHNDKCKKIILIAPFLYPAEDPGPKELLARIPIVSTMVFKSVGPAAIDELIKKSSLPAPAPEHYEKLKDKYQDPKILRQSILEKVGARKKLSQIIDVLKKKEIKIEIVHGAHDKFAAKFSRELKKELGEKVTISVLSNKGHALPWTATGELEQWFKEENKGITNKDSETKFGYFNGEHIKNNVCAFLTDHLQKIADRPILSWVEREDIPKWDGHHETPLPHKSVTVAELDTLTTRVSKGFEKIGIKKGDRAIVFLPMGVGLYVSMFALQKMGAIPVFLDSWARKDQMGVSADVADPVAMISFEMAYDYLKEEQGITKIPIKVVGGEHKGTYAAKIEELMETHQEFDTVPVEREHTALITFTTGSSGTPKGANRTHRFLAAQHYALNRHLPYEDSDADLPVFPIFSLNNLAAGVKTVIPAIDVGRPSDKDAPLLIAQMKHTGTTCTTLSPSLLNAVSDYCIEKNITLPFLRRIITGGAPVSNDDVKRMKQAAPKAEILVLYGSTEVEPMAHIEANEMLSQNFSDDPEIVEEGVNVGKMDSGLQYRFIKIRKDSVLISKKEDWADLVQPDGKVGELIVAGEHVCEGYFNNEEAFFRAKIRDENGVVWHRTGDLGKLDQNQNLWLVGRVHNAINRKGEYCFPVRSEIVMKKLPFVYRCAFLGVDDPELGEKTVCAFSITEGHEKSDNKIEEYKNEIRRMMEKNEIPVDLIVAWDDIPMDPRHHSKVEYAVLRKSLKEKGLV